VRTVATAVATVVATAVAAAILRAVQEDADGWTMNNLDGGGNEEKTWWSP
jgi:hypothetical protein